MKKLVLAWLVSAGLLLVVAQEAQAVLVGPTLGPRTGGQTTGDGALGVFGIQIGTPFPTYGTVTSVSIYSDDDTNLGEIFDFVIMRPTSPTAYTVISRTTGLQPTTKAAIESFTLPSPVYVYPGDLMGEWSEQSGCIPYGSGSVSAYHSTIPYPSSGLIVGQTVTKSFGSTRDYALAAEFTPDPNIPPMIPVGPQPRARVNSNGDGATGLLVVNFDNPMPFDSRIVGIRLFSDTDTNDNEPFDLLILRGTIGNLEVVARVPGLFPYAQNSLQEILLASAVPVKAGDYYGFWGPNSGAIPYDNTDAQDPIRPFRYYPTYPLASNLIDVGDIITGSFSGERRAYSFQVLIVPEPATLTCLGIGLAMAAMARRRRLS